MSDRILSSQQRAQGGCLFIGTPGREIEDPLASGRSASVADQFTELVHAGLLDLPTPGSGRTWQRFCGLAEVAARDLSLGRLAEGHADALAILAEANGAKPAGRLGVWAADPPDGRLLATRQGNGWSLSGLKHWCSGAELLDAALVTAHADDGYRLFFVRLDRPGLSVSTDNWQGVGMRDSVTADVAFDDVWLDTDAAIGNPGWYLDRTGFWAGGVGVAACWYGGALGGVERLAAKLHDGRDDPHALAELGAATALCQSMRAHLLEAARQIDAGITGDDLQRLARTVRSGVERRVAKCCHTWSGVGGRHAEPRPERCPSDRRSAGVPAAASRRTRSRGARARGQHARFRCPHQPVRRPSAPIADMTDARDTTDTMETTPSLTGLGHGESLWRAWDKPPTWPEIRLPASGRVLVVAPHPDDGVLAVGGLMRLLVDRGVAVGLVAVTDGESSHPNSPTHTPEQLARRRVTESHAAFARLGVELECEIRLGLPDGAVTAQEQELATRLRHVTASSDLLIIPWRHDGHPDHDSVGRAGARAAADLDLRCWSYPVWAWHWGTPEEFAVAWRGPGRIDLPPDVLNAKRLAIAAHGSQVRPLSPATGDEAILPPPIRARFERTWETVLS